MSWSLYMLLSSLSWQLPWESCDNAWNSNDSCVTFQERAKLTQYVVFIYLFIDFFNKILHFNLGIFKILFATVLWTCQIQQP